jgi:hypothetical protein
MGYFFHGKSCALILAKIGFATCWAIFYKLVWSPWIGSTPLFGVW